MWERPWREQQGEVEKEVAAALDDGWVAARGRKGYEGSKT